MLCQICGKNISKYTCPLCKIQTCSLECVKLHKKQLNCSGVKPKSQFVPLEKMDAEMLMKDCALIDQVQTSVLDSKAKFPKQKKPKWQKQLKKECQDEGITICFLPHALSRSQENRTRCKDQNVIYWTCRFRFHDENNEIVYNALINDINENSPMGDVLRAIQETSPNDYVAHIDLNQFDLLLVAEGAPGGGHYEIQDLSFTLSEDLFGKTIIEFPIFDIVPKCIFDQFNIVTESDVRNITAQNDVPDNTSQPKDKLIEAKERELLSYETIKDALKLDIITGVLKQAKLEKERKKTILPESKNKS